MNASIRAAVLESAPPPASIDSISSAVAPSAAAASAGLKFARRRARIQTLQGGPGRGRRLQHQLVVAAAHRAQRPDHRRRALAVAHRTRHEPFEFMQVNQDRRGARRIRDVDRFRQLADRVVEPGQRQLQGAGQKRRVAVLGRPRARRIRSRGTRANARYRSRRPLQEFFESGPSAFPRPRPALFESDQVRGSHHLAARHLSLRNVHLCTSSCDSAARPGNAGISCREHGHHNQPNRITSASAMNPTCSIGAGVATSSPRAPRWPGSPELYRCDRCRGVPALRRLDELGEAANRPNNPQGETRVSPAPGGRISSTRGHLLAQA